ncbi:hypothetical protein F3Y22_tig00110562pilonHSYRG00041 [Hibiscus syriacus]|uniref:Neprosin PEP catalytic domain-containing protein n=1 Tax=Hibiscus syriacus TaxID=106335 RepID=A0A6A3AAQ6_HIBSY|nr:uncharacterized protein LOC120132393 [Hibiscus syriacus]KAE8700072.1 hypothetical protein F3Y22_tig00110562pilonHSYRG00041 [Hibiscus syriacus]
MIVWGLYEQPAVHHSLLKNHKIQMRPSFDPQRDYTNPTGNGTPDNSIDLVLMDACPSRTVPIRRRSTFAGIVTRDNPATVYYGAGGMVSIINPAVTSGQASASVISLEGGPPDQFSVIRVGWMVGILRDQGATGLASLTLSIPQRQNGQMIGCYNTYCPGFVQTDPSIELDMTLGPISVVRGPQYYIKLSVTQDISGSNTATTKSRSGIGQVVYSPTWATVHPGLRWGGMGSSSTGQVPPMGNGDNGEIHSSHFRQLVLQYEAGTSLNGSVDVPLDVVQTRSYKCGNNYYKGEFWGYSFYFGGDGGDATQCC